MEGNNSDPRGRLVGINHVALDVGDLVAALEFYGRIFEFTADTSEAGMAFVEMGDQFIALTEHDEPAPDETRHFGLVVDDKEVVRAALQRAGVAISPGRRLNFRDPWGNQIQVVDYRDIRFTKAQPVLDGMGLGGLNKRDAALEELRRSGLR
jgi:catechol 2,3-dioxygenase-like lactoylglutathione lyase family enzyme